MSHAYDAQEMNKEYPYGNRKEDGTLYEATPAFISYILDGSYTGEVAGLHAQDIAHNVRQAYPSLAVAAVDVEIPLVLRVTVEGQRLTELQALVQVGNFLEYLKPVTAEVRQYSADLRYGTGLVLRNVSLTPSSTLPIKPALPAEIEAAKEAARIL